MRAVLDGRTCARDRCLTAGCADGSRPASSRCSSRPGPPALIALRAWDYLGDVIGDDLEAMFGRPLDIRERWLPVSESLQLATIAMSLPTEQLELCVSIVADTESRRWLAGKRCSVTRRAR